MIKVIYLIIATIFSAIFYRAGGQSKDPTSNPKWMPMWLRHSWVRDLGCTLLTLGYIFFFPTIAWYWYLLAFGAMYGFMTTYWDSINGKDNFYLHGLFIRLALLFVAIPMGHWVGCLFSAIALSLAMGIWCNIFSNDVVEEFGRGSFIILTLPIMIF